MVIVVLKDVLRSTSASRRASEGRAEWKLKVKDCRYELQNEREKEKRKKT